MTETAIYGFAAEAYRLLEQAAEVNEHEELIFEGFLSKVIKRSGASKTYYSGIRRLLDSPTNDPCIEVRERGAGFKPSVVLLRHPPPREWSGIRQQDLTGPDSLATLVETGKRMQTFLDGIGGINLQESLRNIESRLSSLEKERGHERETGGLSGKKAKKHTKAT